jgi:hypothetical protein
MITGYNKEAIRVDYGGCPFGQYHRACLGPALQLAKMSSRYVAATKKVINNMPTQLSNTCPLTVKMCCPCFPVLHHVFGNLHKE